MEVKPLEAADQTGGRPLAPDLQAVGDADTLQIQLVIATSPSMSRQYIWRSRDLRGIKEFHIASAGLARDPNYKRGVINMSVEEVCAIAKVPGLMCQLYWGCVRPF